MGKKIALIFFLFFCLLCNCTYLFAEEDSVSFVTYYPAPYGYYNEFTVASRSAIGNVNGDSEGKVNSDDMAVDNFGNPVPGSLTVAGKVGIGTRQPTEKLDVSGKVKATGFCIADDCYSSFGIEFALIEETKPAGVNGGVFPSGSWLVRKLNNISVPADFVDLDTSTNQIILKQEGTYIFRITAPANYVNFHRSALKNATSGEFVAYGKTEETNRLYVNTNDSVTIGKVIITEATLNSRFEALHICNLNYDIDTELGYAWDFGIPEIYTQVEVWKIK